MHENRKIFCFCCAEKDSSSALELLRKRRRKNELSESEKRQLAFMERRMEESRIYLTPAVIYAAANQESFGKWILKVENDQVEHWYARGIAWMRRHSEFLDKFGWKERRNAIIAAGILATAENEPGEDPLNQVRRMMRGTWKLLWEKMKNRKVLSFEVWRELLEPWEDSENMSSGMAGVLILMAHLNNRPVLERERFWRDLQKLRRFVGESLRVEMKTKAAEEETEESDNRKMEWLLAHFRNPQRPAYIREKDRVESEWLEQLHRIMIKAGLPAYACESMCLSGEEVLEILDEMEGKLTECQYMTFMTLYSVSKELAAAGNAAAPLDIWNE